MFATERRQHEKPPGEPPQRSVLVKDIDVNFCDAWGSRLGQWAEEREVPSVETRHGVDLLVAPSVDKQLRSKRCSVIDEDVMVGR